MTLVEKILSRHSRYKLRAGDIGVCKVDFCFSQDGTSSLVMDSLRKFKKISLKKPRAFSMFIDHNAPSPNIGVSSVHKMMREFSKKYGTLLYDVGCGISHQVVMEEGFIWPGRIILGADSHTSTGGVLGAACFGVGSTDLAITLIYGKNWFKVPQTFKVLLKGKVPSGVFSKDIALEVARVLTAQGATYRAIEYEGEVLKSLSIDARAVLTNMSIEFGAKTAIISPDKKVFDFLKRIGVNSYKPVYPDKDAYYERIVEIRVDKLQPLLAKPHSVDNVTEVEEVEGEHITEAFLGTCTNGRLEDLAIAARILKGRRVSKNVKLLIAPASFRILKEAQWRGYIKIFLEAGGIILPCGCGPCVGTHQGVPEDGGVVISSANRNFKGRMGNPNASIYLASPATVVASSIRGKITDPRRFL